MRLNKERGAKNDSWAPGLSNREEKRKSWRRRRKCQFISERGQNKRVTFQETLK